MRTMGLGWLFNLDLNEGQSFVLFYGPWKRHNFGNATLAEGSLWEGLNDEPLV